ncbi:SulP family inorganic anion transporter [Falsarthrobacter nasiphocae]|uniref:SulP family sulfate permease n=1 Tax=Falsarthrobacter nasiphocae TaxID=189863 RepID=A0AAE4C5V9_9MICC|nr:SulP family inorganic anion transporter [Falsarthrobacter nasiphocae]MDR6892701.1 SulP family sulfate permease [Falsarthrobacter nasiphocae]
MTIPHPDSSGSPSPRPVAAPSASDLGPAAGLSPAQRQSVRVVLRSPRLLWTETMAGLITSLALIPEVLAFSILAGVDPAVGLFTSVIMAITSAVVGGRPAMVTAAAGAVALVTAPLVRSHGQEYLVAAVLLGGLIQIGLGFAGVSRLMRFVSPAVMRGFVNSLAILMAAAQLPEVIGVPWAVYPVAALGLILVIVMPRLTRAVPAPFAAIVVCTGLVWALGWQVPEVGDKGKMPTALPLPGLPDVPLDAAALGAVAPYAVAIALVGIVESLMTQRLVDSLTQTESNAPREVRGQGIANIAAGLFGGMGGCAMIGQTMMNVKTGGGRSRVSAAMAGLWLLGLVMLLSPVVAHIPMAVLVAVMLYISATTFDWGSVAPASLRRIPWTETLVMLVTVAIVVPTHNLAAGVVVGAALGWALARRRGRRGERFAP